MRGIGIGSEGYLGELRFLGGAGDSWVELEIAIGSEGYLGEGGFLGGAGDSWVEWGILEMKDFR